MFSGVGCRYTYRKRKPQGLNISRIGIQCANSPKSADTKLTQPPPRMRWRKHSHPDKNKLTAGHQNTILLLFMSSRSLFFLPGWARFDALASVTRQGREPWGWRRLVDGFVFVVAWSSVASSPQALLRERLTPRAGFRLGGSNDFFSDDVEASTAVRGDKDPTAVVVVDDDDDSLGTVAGDTEDSSTVKVVDNEEDPTAVEASGFGPLSSLRLLAGG